MEYMNQDEIKWGKAQGLKKTNMRTRSYPSDRVVYKATDGKLYYRDANFWHGTYEYDCYDIKEYHTCRECNHFKENGYQSCTVYPCVSRDWSRACIYIDIKEE